MSTPVSPEGMQATGSVITDRHFGLNFVADFERIGSKPWERFDDIATNLGSTNTRYPGGIAAEQIFDYRTPNRSQISLANGESVNFAPLSYYLQYCNANKINPTIIVPVSQLLSDTQHDNHRTFDESQTEPLSDFIYAIMNSVDPSLTLSLELGNEYEGYMTSTEYGRIANALISIIETTASDLPNMKEPEIYVQSWAYSIGGGLTPEDLATRNQQVIAQIDPKNLSALDGVVSHYYFLDGRNAGNSNEQTFGNIADQIDWIANLHSVWNQASGNNLTSRISEWNVSHRTDADLGLKQLQPLMEMFTSFLRSGVDSLDFWSTQYHRTSAADASGRLMAAGTLLDVLLETTIGTQVGETSRSEDFSTYTFLSAGRQINVLTSSDDHQVTIDVSPSALSSELTLLGGYIIGVNEATADGSFKGLTNLPAYAEPDAAITLVNIPMSVVTSKATQIILDPFESLVLVYEKIDPLLAVVHGTDFAEWLYGTNRPSFYLGGGGWDTVNYITSSTSVDVRLDNSYGLGGSAQDRFFSVESVLGSNYGDRISGKYSADLISGRGGADELYGGRGADSIFGDDGSDSIFGGAGNDEIRGGADDDFLYGGGGDDIIFGDDGFDTLSFEDFGAGVSAWFQDGVVETEWGRVKFAGIEQFLGTQFDDRFVLTDGAATIVAGTGDDSVQVRGDGYRALDMGDGNDSAQVYSGQVDFLGGAGADRLFAVSSGGFFNGGEGNDRARILGSGWILEGGEGSDELVVSGRGNRFIFSGEVGHDRIEGFNIDTDVLIFRGPGCEGAQLFNDALGSTVTFSDDSSIYFADTNLLDLSGVEWMLT